MSNAGFLAGHVALMSNLGAYKGGGKRPPRKPKHDKALAVIKALVIAAAVLSVAYILSTP